MVQTNYIPFINKTQIFMKETASAYVTPIRIGKHLRGCFLEMSNMTRKQRFALILL